MRQSVLRQLLDSQELLNALQKHNVKNQFFSNSAKNRNHQKHEYKKTKIIYLLITCEAFSPSPSWTGPGLVGRWPWKSHSWTNTRDNSCPGGRSGGSETGTRRGTVRGTKAWVWDRIFGEAFGIELSFNKKFAGRNSAQVVDNFKGWGAFPLSYERI